jgi:hypothetical protein
LLIILCFRRWKVLGVGKQKKIRSREGSNKASNFCASAAVTLPGKILSISNFKIIPIRMFLSFGRFFLGNFWRGTVNKGEETSLVTVVIDGTLQLALHSSPS